MSNLLEKHPIRVLRQERELSIGKLAELLETGPSTITNWEYMDRLPDLFGFLKLLRAFPDLDARAFGETLKEWQSGLEVRRTHPDHPEYGKPIRSGRPKKPIA